MGDPDIRVTMGNPEKVSQDANHSGREDGQPEREKRRRWRKKEGREALPMVRKRKENALVDARSGYVVALR